MKRIKLPVIEANDPQPLEKFGLQLSIWQPGSRLVQRHEKVFVTREELAAIVEKIKGVVGK